MILVEFEPLSTTGASEVQAHGFVRDRGFSQQTYEVTVTGSPTAVALSIEGSISGDNFQSLGDCVFTSEQLAAGYAMFHIAYKTVPKIRVNVTALTGGTSPTIKIKGVFA